MLTAIIGPRHAPRKKPGVRARRTGTLEGNDEDEDADADGCEEERLLWYLRQRGE